MPAYTAHGRAAMRIQRFWLRVRHARTWRLASAFQADARLSIDGVRNAVFGEFTVHLRNREVIARTKALLQRLHCIAVHRHGNRPAVERPDTINVRVFLAAYMIAFHSTKVFETFGVLQRRVIDAATNLLALYARIVAQLARERRTGVIALPYALTTDFMPLLYTYIRCFHEWKAPDEERLVARIKRALWSLQEGRRGVNAATEPGVLLEFDAQIARLREKMRQFGGQDALDQFDAQPTPPDGLVALRAERRHVTNEQLAHELLLDPLYRLDLAKCVSPAALELREAYWMSLIDDLSLQTGPIYSRALGVVTEIRGDIVDLADRQVEARMIQEIVDHRIMQQHTLHGTFTWPEAIRLLEHMQRVLYRLVIRDPGTAPQHGMEMQAGWTARMQALARFPPDHAATAPMPREQARFLVDALRFLMDHIAQLRIDRANDRLRLISPVIAVNGVGYERGKFADLLAAGGVTLDRTRSWIARVVRAATPALQARLRAKEDEALVELHVRGVVVLSTDEPSPPPEVLRFDEARLADAHTDFERLVDLATHTLLLFRRRELGHLTADEAALELSTLENGGDPPPPFPANATPPVRALLQTRLRELIAVAAHGTLTRAAAITDPRFRSLRPAVLDRAFVIAQTIARVASISRAVHASTLDALVAAELLPPPAEEGDGDAPMPDRTGA